MNTTRIYAAYCKDEKIRNNSFSGGIFSVLAEYVIGNNGSVWGVVFDEQMQAIYKEVMSIDELSRLRGSKYVFARMGREVVSCVKERLEQGKLVLFCGTPCQVETVVKAVGHLNRNKLIAVDFICHGTPSIEVWEAYLKELRKKGALKAINMRNKRFGWKTYSFKVDYVDGKSSREIFTFNHYSHAFLGNFSLRKACYDCVFKGIRPSSDITLADYWDISRKHPKMNDGQGISKLYIHTDNGDKFLETISSSINICFDEEVNEYITEKIQLKIPSTRDLFFDILRTDGFEAAYRKTVYKGCIWWLKNLLKGVVKICMYYLK